MSELDKLRELLDEAGVSYLNHRSDVTIGYYTNDPHGVIEAMDHSLQVTGLTAEQVIKALGPGTCEMEYVSDFMSWHCKACDQMDMAPRNPKPRYCKWCGRKVVDE